VFFHLANLLPGDEILVTRLDGMVAVFTVEAVNQYPKDDFPTDLFCGDIDHRDLARLHSRWRSLTERLGGR
jgi:hypothetical protein